MRSIRLIFILALTAALFGCASGISPVSGILYSDVKAPLAVTDAEKGSKTGTAVCKSYLGAVATGDCSIDAAAKQGGITKIKHVDFKTENYFLIFAKYTVIVYGE